MQATRILIFLSLASSALVVLASSNHLSLATVDAEPKLPSKFSFSKLFDFKAFKSLFHKSYKSPGEESRREKIFMSNLLRSFLSKIGYKHKKNSSYLSVNSMSDWTEDEFEKTLMDMNVYLESQELDSDEQQALASLIEQQMVGVDGELAKEKSKSSVDFKKYLSKISLSNLNLGDRFFSLAKFMNDKSIEATNNVEGFLWRFWHNLPKQSDLPDEVFVDHRDSGCMPPVKSQRRCGGCYIFSTTALYEWAYCRLTGKQARFSEQYVIDCGRRINLNGCNGGRETWVADFVERYGFESSSDIFYTAKEGICPYDKLDDDYDDDGQPRSDSTGGRLAARDHTEDTEEPIDDDSMGMFRLDKPKLFRVGLDNIEKQLKVSPVLIALRTSATFQHYGGGVDLGHGCEKKHTLHSMLIVGSGRENGLEYWLVRNSHGKNWGDQGHWKIAKNNNCYTLGNLGITLRALDYRKVPKELVNGTIPIVELNQPDALVYNFMENPKHSRDFIIKSVTRIMRKLRPV